MKTTDQLKDQFLMLYSIALADDRVDPRELKFLHEWGVERGISQEEMDELLLSPEKPALSKLEALPEKIEFLYLGAAMILADDVVDKREQAVFRSMCRYMGFLEENIQELMDFMLDQVRRGVPLHDVQEIVRMNTES